MRDADPSWQGAATAGWASRTACGRARPRPSARSVSRRRPDVAAPGARGPRLFREVIARERRLHVPAVEQHGDDDLDAGVAAQALTADGRARGLAAIAEELHED